MDVLIDLRCVPINVLGIFTDLLRTLVNALNIFTYSLCVLVNIFGSFANVLRALVDVFGVLTDPLCVLVGVLLYRRLSKMLDNPLDSVGYTHLVIHHSNIQVSDGTAQGLGMTRIF